MNRRINNAVRFVNRQSRKASYAVGSAVKSVRPKPRSMFKDGLKFGLGFMAASVMVAVAMYGIFFTAMMRIIG